MYDNKSLAFRLQLACIVCFAIVYVALVIAWKFYVPPKIVEPIVEEPSPPRSNRSIFEEALRSNLERTSVIET